MNPLIYKLTVVHRRLEDEIRQELKKRLPDTLRLLRLKKLRLAVKDRLHNLMLNMPRSSASWARSRST